LHRLEAAIRRAAVSPLMSEGASLIDRALVQALELLQEDALED
jgi:hypothetical protein